MLNATVSGYVGKSELRQSSQGKDILNFSVAHGERVNGIEKTTWVRCAVFGARATTLSEYIRKGTFITATGQLKVSVYVPNQGEPSMNVDMIVSDLAFNNPSSLNDNMQKDAKKVPEETSTDKFGDDVPF